MGPPGPTDPARRLKWAARSWELWEKEKQAERNEERGVWERGWMVCFFLDTHCSLSIVLLLVASPLPLWGQRWELHCERFRDLLELQTKLDLSLNS